MVLNRFVILLAAPLAFLPTHAASLDDMSPLIDAPVVNAPEFPQGLEWLNTDHPLTLRQFRGKVVLLDFWTYCCINCIHVFPDLKRLEDKYGDALVVIGVHSAKFTTEKGTRNIREAILRYGLEHPVVNDRDLEVWDAYAITAWPTIVLIDPAGKEVGRHAGEGVFDAFDDVIGGLIVMHDARNQIDRNRFALERDKVPESILSFPSKIAADSTGARLFITDSNHNRIVIMSLPDAAVTGVVGSGEAGLADGDFARARFNKPQGIALSGTTLYVADTDNHAVRAVDLDRGTVSTVAGTGVQASTPGVGGKDGAVSLNSPWDLVVDGRTLYVAMAGAHQVWAVDLTTGGAHPYAGSGRENLVDGPLTDAALAQPSGITREGTKLYIADSEASAIRVIDMRRGARVETIVGKGLFDFGDSDGRGETVRLQHPLGVFAHGGRLYVADTYNNKIKVIDPSTKTASTLIGTGSVGMKDGPAAEAELNEPNGLAFAGGRLYITDTNNHLIRVFSPSNGQLSTLALHNAEMLLTPRPSRKKEFRGETVTLAEQAVAAGRGTIAVHVTIPEGYVMNTLAPFSLTLVPRDSAIVKVREEDAERSIENPSFPVTVPVLFASGRTVVTIDCVVYYCEEQKENLCLVKQLRVAVPIRAGEPGGGSRVDVPVTIAATRF
jgi:YVTN family beta-propeller protein